MHQSKKSKNKSDRNLSARISNGFHLPLPKQESKRYWVLECSANDPSEPVRQIDLLGIASIYVPRLGNADREDEEACRRVGYMLQGARSPCNCMFLFNNSIKVWPLDWINSWLENIQDKAIAHFETKNFESVIDLSIASELKEFKAWHLNPSSPTN